MKEERKTKLSPMMDHYMQKKAENPDCLLLYRLGDFYECFFEDALTVSKDLEITLTARDCGDGEKAPMCGVPYHALDSYLAKLVNKGYSFVKQNGALFSTILFGSAAWYASQ